MVGASRSSRRPGRAAARGRPVGAARPAARRPAPSARPARGLFLPSKTQQVAGACAARVPLADLAAAGAMLGALLLWGLALHLLGA